MIRGQQQGRAAARRASRRFQPGVGEVLERREVLSGAVATAGAADPPAELATPTVAADIPAEVTAAAETANRPARARPTAAQAAAARTAAQIARWNSPGNWRWVNGKWATRLRADLLAELVRQSGGSSETVTEVTSSDTWTASASGVRVQSGETAPTAEDEPAIRFNPDGKPTFRFGVTQADGQMGVVILTATSASASTITFRGEVPSTNQEGGTAETTPLSVTVRRNGSRGFQILSDIGDAPVTTRLLTYTATKQPARPAARR